MRASHAVSLGASMNFLGALTGTAVAATIGSKVVRPEFATETTPLGAIGAAVLWVMLATRYGIPVSVSHSLFAGLVGAGIASGGVDAIVASSAIKIVIALAASPVLGFFGGLLLMHIVYWTFRRTAYSTVNGIFGRLQILSGSVRDVCDARTRVSRRSGSEKTRKFTENQEPESKSLTVP